MSLLPPSTVKHIAEMHGFPEVEDDVSQKLSNDLEYTLREVVQDGLKFMRNAKRRKLTPEDINHALQLRNFEPIYGFGLPEAAEDKLFKKIPNSDVHVLADRVIDLNDLIHAPLPPVPLDISFEAHWLAVDGVQPAIPQNPPAVISHTVPEVTPAEGKEKGDEKEKREKDKAPALLSKEASKSAVPLLKHTLSRELQVYYEHVVDVLAPAEDRDGEHVSVLLQSLAFDAGLHQLVPYLCSLLAEKAQQYVARNVHVLHLVLDMIRALLENPHLYLEHYVHQLIPVVITCCVARSLSVAHASLHWEVRDKAAALLAALCAKFGKHSNIYSRVSKTLTDAIHDRSKSLVSHYGAFKALICMGRLLVEAVVIDYIPEYLAETLKLSEMQVPEDGDAQRVYDLLKKCSVDYLASSVGHGVHAKVPFPSSSSNTRYEKLAQWFGPEAFQTIDLVLSNPL